jgi:hypothetical protein
MLSVTTPDVIKIVLKPTIYIVKVLKKEMEFFRIFKYGGFYAVKIL